MHAASLQATELTRSVDIDGGGRRLDQFDVGVDGVIGREEAGDRARVAAGDWLEARVVGRRLVVVAGMGAAGAVVDWA